MTKTLAVHSFKGGTGKSTITANLASALATRGKNVGVMDMDLEGPGLHIIFNIRPDEIKQTLNDVLMDSASPEDAVIDMSQRLGLKNGKLYFSPASVTVSEMLRTLRTGFELESFSRAIAKLAASFSLDYLLIDTHPGIENDTLLAIGACRHLIIVSRIDQQDIFGTGVIVDVASTLEKPSHLLVNMVPKGLKPADASKLVRGIGHHFKIDVAGWLPFSEPVQDSLSKSVFILTSPKDTMVSRFQELAKQVEGYN